MDILVVEEKHGNRHFDASTPEKLHAACVKILKQRLKEGWYTPGDEPKLDYIDVSDIPDSLKDLAVIEIKRYKSQHKWWEQEVRDFDDINRVISFTGKLKLYNRQPESYGILEQRSNGEYERVHIEHLENIDD